jgi:type I restriction enzyme S subunit
MKYKKYPRYKDSGVEWLEDVPAHWDIVRNKVAFLFVKSLVGEHSANYKLLSLTLKGIILRDIESGKGKFPAEFDTYQEVKKKDLVFCLFDIDETPRTIGISKYDGMITGAYNVARCNPNMANSKFMYYYYLSVDEYKGLKPFYTGLRKVVRTETFMNIQLGLPPLKEQQQIAKFLDNATQKMDTLIKSQERLIELLKEKRQAVISHAVTKGLNPDVKFKDSGVEWLGDVPEHWGVKQYRYATKIYRGKFTHRPRNDPKFYDGKYPFIQTGDIARANKYILNYSQTLNERGISVSEKFPKGSLVMTIAANIGDVAILNFEAYAPDSIVSFAPTKLTNLMFLRYSFIGLINVLKSTAIQSTQANLNVDRIGSLIATFPSFNEQQEIANYLDDKTNKIDTLIEKSKQSIKLLKEKRTALISSAVTGKIDVRGLV